MTSLQPEHSSRSVDHRFTTWRRGCTNSVVVLMGMVLKLAMSA